MTVERQNVHLSSLTDGIEQRDVIPVNHCQSIEYSSLKNQNLACPTRGSQLHNSPQNRNIYLILLVPLISHTKIDRGALDYNMP